MLRTSGVAGAAIIRAVALALPVALVLGLVLSGADPTFAAWRDTIANVRATCRSVASGSIYR